MAVQWLRLCAASARGTVSIPGWGTKVMYAGQDSQKKKKKKQVERLLEKIIDTKAFSKTESKMQSQLLLIRQ